MIKDNIVVLGGEVKGIVSLAKVNEYVLKALEEIGYDAYYSVRWHDNASEPQSPKQAGLSAVRGVLGT